MFPFLGHRHRHVPSNCWQVLSHACSLVIFSFIILRVVLINQLPRYNPQARATASSMMYVSETKYTITKSIPTNIINTNVLSVYSRLNRFWIKLRSREDHVLNQDMGYFTLPGASISKIIFNSITYRQVGSDVIRTHTYLQLNRFLFQQTDVASNYFTGRSCHSDLSYRVTQCEFIVQQLLAGCLEWNDSRIGRGYEYLNYCITP